MSKTKRFKRIYVEITNACNLTCSICPGTKRNTLFMPPESFEMILKKIKPFTDHLYLHVMGEPLLHPEFPALMGICEALGFQVNIATNGVLIRRYRETLFESKSLRQINFSIHCMDIQKNSKLPDAYLPEILDFTGEGSKKSKAYFALRLWNFKPGNEMNSRILKQIEDFYNLPFNLEGRIIKEKGISLAPNVFLNIAEEFTWPDINSISKYPDASSFCRGLRDHCAILVDGTVVPCCLDNDGIITLGNIFESELDNIITSKKAQNIINGFSEGKAIEPLCKSCEFRKRFSKS